jgi:hypothetical protein
MKCYLAGPMAGRAEHNWPLFKRVAAYLRERDYDILCPTESGGKEELGYIPSLKLSLIHMLKADALILLPGWMMSRGATIELLLATLLEYKVYEADIDLDQIGLWKKDYTRLFVIRCFLTMWFKEEYDNL